MQRSLADSFGFSYAHIGDENEIYVPLDSIGMFRGKYEMFHEIRSEFSRYNVE